MILAILGIIAVILLLILYRYLPNKKIFACFVATLIAAAAVVCSFWTHPEPSEPTMTADELYERQQQQQIFADWYADYQRDIAELDRNWQWYHHILENFKEDNISIQTTYVRLQQLELDSQQLKDRLANNAPPQALNDGCYDLLIEVIKKTNAYAEAQQRTITLTRAAADPAKLKTNDQAEQSRLLQTIMLKESPTGLFIANEIRAIRDYLAIDENTTNNNAN